MSGILVGVLAFFGLLFGTSALGGSGPVELLLCLVVAVAGGAVVTRLLRLGSADEE